MNYITLGLVVFLTIIAWLIVGYCIYQSRQRKKTPAPNPLLGYIEEVIQDENGITVKGVLNDAGMEYAKAHGNSLGMMSTQFRMNESESENGVRVIKDAKLLGVSLDLEPGSGGGRIESVDGAPYVNPISTDAIIAEKKPIDHVGTQPSDA